MSQRDLFADGVASEIRITEVSPDVWLLKGYLLASIDEWLAQLREVVRAAPLTQMQTLGGKPMSVRTTSCGNYGWIGDRRGYRYSPKQPVSGQSWPSLPEEVKTLMTNLHRDLSAQGSSLVEDFAPDSALLNLYRPGSRMGLHQDRDEVDFGSPIVSLSFGLPVIFLLAGLERSGARQKILLEHGDVLVFGGRARLRFHGVAPLKLGTHPLLGAQRLNVTLRRAR